PPRPRIGPVPGLAGDQTVEPRRAGRTRGRPVLELRHFNAEVRVAGELPGQHGGHVRIRLDTGHRHAASGEGGGGDAGTGADLEHVTAGQHRDDVVHQLVRVPGTQPVVVRRDRPEAERAYLVDVGRATRRAFDTHG